MALVTVQRSPSPSTDHDADSLSEDTTDGKSHAKRRQKTSKEKLRKVLSSVRFLSRLRPGLSESYFAYKGAALILPHTERTRKSSKKNHGGEIHDHLQAMLLLLRPVDQIKIAVRLEDVPDSTYRRYICVVATRGRQDTEEAVILGMECRHGEAVIGLVLPIWLGVKIQLEGDGSFRLCTDEQAYLFNPVSVQAMWSAIQSLVKVLNNAEEMKYIHDGLTHTWVEYYRSRIDHSHVARNHYWNVEGVQVFAPSVFNLDDESVKRSMSNTIKEVMMSLDLDDVTCKALRVAVEDKLGFSIRKYKAFFDEEMLRIFGQMKGPAKIMDYLYLGSEWNASNLDELKANGIGYILNVTKEIDNFFTGTFHYYTVRLIDAPESDLLKHWDKTFKFISKARSHGSKVFVHCKMGISRSASTVMAYLMKEYRWSLNEAFKFVKDRRTIANPNEGFMEQLKMYEAILSASNKREYFATKALDNQPSPLDEEGLSGEGMMDQDYDCVLGDSMMNVMASDWSNIMPLSAALEDDLEQLQYGSRALPLGPDLEGAESRSGDSLDESLPDMSSPPLSCEKPKNGGSDQTCANPSGSPGLFKVKPDSFWIKQEEDTVTSDGSYVEMKEESDNCNNLKSPAPSSNLDDKLSSSSLSENGSENPLIVSSCPSNPLSDTVSFPTSGASFPPIPDSFSQICSHDIHPSSSISSTTLSTKVEGPGEDAATSKSTLPHVNSQQDGSVKQLESDCLQSAMPKHNCETNSNILPPHNPNTIPPASDAFNSMQSNDKPEMAAAAITIPSVPLAINPQGKVESGVRDYFFREKIPWNPGKVQKIRKGIDRVGLMAGDDDREGNELPGMAVSSPCVTADRHEDMAVEDDSRFKMDIDKEKIILDECMEVTNPNSLCDSTVKTKENDATCNSELAGALSLYEKEEIPLEPGTVLRTRMEIEERQKFSVGDGESQAPTSPTKPVLRTSSLKMTNTESHQPSNLLPRRVSCGPVMDQIRYMKNVENDNLSGDDVMMEEDDDENEIVDAMSANNRLTLVEKSTMEEPKHPDLCIGLGQNLQLESNTDSEKAEDSSGIVKSVVRKLEKLPSNEQKATTGTEAVAMQDSCNDSKSPLDPLALNSRNSDDTIIDLGFQSGESNTDNEVLIDESNDPLHMTSKSDVTTVVVRHLVGQFEPKAVQECKTEDPRLTEFEACSLQCGDNEHVAQIETTESMSDKLPSDLLSGSADSQLSTSSVQQSLTENIFNAADGAQSCKEVWNPYQQMSPQSSVEDISSLRQKFEAKNLKEEVEFEGSKQNACHSTEKNRKLPRPKSVERMCGIFEGKSKSDPSLTEERKEDVETTLRQVSEEGRKVRRLHGKSHPLTKLSQGRGVFHSSM